MVGPGFLYRRLARNSGFARFFSLPAVLAAAAASVADSFGCEDLVPRVDRDTVEKLLSVGALAQKVG